MKTWWNVCTVQVDCFQMWNCELNFCSKPSYFSIKGRKLSRMSPLFPMLKHPTRRINCSQTHLKGLQFSVSQPNAYLYFWVAPREIARDTLNLFYSLGVKGRFCAKRFQECLYRGRNHPLNHPRIHEGGKVFAAEKVTKESAKNSQGDLEWKVMKFSEIFTDVSKTQILCELTDRLNSNTMTVTSVKYEFDRCHCQKWQNVCHFKSKLWQDWF